MRPLGHPEMSVVAECLALVAPAEDAFTSRWRFSTLKRLQPDLAARVDEQRQLYEASLVTGSDADTREQAGAMVRGWHAACAALEQPLQPDDAYLIGEDTRSGTKVVISDHLGAGARVQRLHGREIVQLTPDEVASIVAGMRILSEAKRAFPDAELIRGGELLQADAA